MTTPFQKAFTDASVSGWANNGAKAPRPNGARILSITTETMRTKNFSACRARVQGMDPETLTDIQKAVRFYYLLKGGYGGKIKSQTFGLSMIRKADREHTFFYIDPPYYGFEDYYGKGVFDRKDFESLKDILSQIKGKFLMSINDTEEICELFKSFGLERVETVYTAAGGAGAKKVQALLIMNYSPN